jgi:hypothetical protein
MNCVHGIDDRFCAVCNRTRDPQPRNALGDVSLDEILQFLNHDKVRATYGAVAEVLGVIPRSMGARLGTRRPEASWIVSASNGLQSTGQVLHRRVCGCFGKSHRLSQRDREFRCA